MTKIIFEMVDFTTRPILWHLPAWPWPHSSPIEGVRSLPSGEGSSMESISSADLLKQVVFGAGQKGDSDRALAATKVLFVTAAVFIGSWGGLRVICWAARFFSGAIIPPWAWACEGMASSTAGGIVSDFAAIRTGLRDTGLGILFRGKGGRPLEVSNAQLEYLLGKTGGNQRKAARMSKSLLGRRVSLKTINRRVKNAPEGTRLKTYQTMMGRPGGVQSRSDDEIAAALRRRKRDRGKAAHDLGLAKETVDHRVEQAGTGSPLLEFRRDAYSNEEILWALRIHKWCMTATAGALGRSVETLRYRLRRILG